MRADKLWVFTARFNPVRWRIPEQTYKAWVEHMLDSGVNLVVVECQYGERPFCCDISPHIRHIGVRASSPAWTKENLVNLGMYRSPEAEYLAWIDADVFYEKAGWASETVEALQLYHWVQPWTQALDRGPHGEVLNGSQAFRSWAYQYEQGAPLVPDRQGWKNCYGQPYPHPGYAHASRRLILDKIGGLFEVGGMGSSDHAMCLALVGKALSSAPKHINRAYVEHLLRWQAKAQAAVHGRIGYVNAVINHRFHGKKGKRSYLGRWNMFLRHGFDPDVDLKRNLYGVLEWAGNKPELEREWMLYLRSRSEDDNSAE